jgi:hypothetical protein
MRQGKGEKAKLWNSPSNPSLVNLCSWGPCMGRISDMSFPLLLSLKVSPSVLTFSAGHPGPSLVPFSSESHRWLCSEL